MPPECLYARARVTVRSCSRHKQPHGEAGAVRTRIILRTIQLQSYSLNHGHKIINYNFYTAEGTRFGAAGGYANPLARLVALRLCLALSLGRASHPAPSQSLTAQMRLTKKCVYALHQILLLPVRTQLLRTNTRIRTKRSRPPRAPVPPRLPRKPFVTFSGALMVTHIKQDSKYTVVAAPSPNPARLLPNPLTPVDGVPIQSGRSAGFEPAERKIKPFKSLRQAYRRGLDVGAVSQVPPGPVPFLVIKILEACTKKWIRADGGGRVAVPSASLIRYTMDRSRVADGKKTLLMGVGIHC